MSGSTSAAPQMHGYLYQIERALVHLAEVNSKADVYIETEDDVVVKVRGFMAASSSPSKEEILKNIYEQDKLTTRNINPFANGSKNLWKTLNIWIKLINEGLEPNQSRFLLCTNKVISGNTSFAKKISRANQDDQLEEVYNLLYTYCQNRKDKDLFKPFLSFNKKMAKLLIRNIELVESSYKKNRGDFYDELRNSLNISHELPFNAIIQSLLGYLLDVILDCWAKGDPAVIQTDSFYRKFNDTIALYASKPFVELTKDLIPISEFQRNKYLKSKFVNQLDLIKVSEREKQQAIDDFIRDSTQRSRFAKDGVITSRDWERFENDLFEHWDDSYTYCSRLGDYNNEEDRGFDVYDKCKKHRGELAGVKTTQGFTNKGTYHRLANVDKIGWHTNWKTFSDEEE